MPIEKSKLEDACKKYEIPFDLAASVVFQESRGDKWAFRYEKAWYAKHIDWRTRNMLSGYVPPEFKCTLKSEKILRASSMGYFQLLGESMRSIMKYKGDTLLSLCDPDLNIDLGVRFLLNCKKRAEKKHKKLNDIWFDTLYLYNGSKSYPPLILDHMNKNRWKDILI